MAARPKQKAVSERPGKKGRILIYRHPVWVRILHWLIAISIIALMMSGLNILRAHPHLYWGTASSFGNAWLDIPAIPDWMTIPNFYSLAQGRRWHFFFAWIFVFGGFAYFILLIASGRLKRRWAPTRDDWRGFGRSIADHARLRFPKGEDARNYNIIQKLTYLAIGFVILPLMLISGLGMSPGFNATGVGKFVLDIFGGRQSLRTLHFLSASAVFIFFIVHVGLVLWTGVFNNLRAMTTGWFAIETKPKKKGDDS